MEPDGERILNSDQVLKLSVLPMSLLIVGGGVIGCEFASLFADLGCEVTVVEVLPSLLGLADADAAVTRELERLFKKRKYRMHLGCKMESLTATPDGIEARLDNGKIVKSERCLISVGRRLNTGGLGLEAVGLAVQEDAPVPVDAHLATSVPGLYAIGDMTGQVQLAHLATHHGIVAARHALGESGAKIDLDAVPSVVFTRPALAWVGLSEARAAERGLEFVTGQTLARGLGKAHVAGALDGLIKVLADRKTGRVLGVHAIGAGAEDVIAEATLAVRHGLTLRQLVDTIHPHPTMSEGLWEAAAAALASL
jgi:dihydrolipoamide dehydrogenase